MQPNNSTKIAEAKDAESSHESDRPPTPQEVISADESRQDPELKKERDEVEDNIEEMNLLGSEVKGEGQIS